MPFVRAGILKPVCVQKMLFGSKMNQAEQSQELEIEPNPVPTAALSGHRFHVRVLGAWAERCFEGQKGQSWY